jgi:bla regulator protein blaR1
MGTTILRSLLFVACVAGSAIAVEPGTTRDSFILLGAHRANHVIGDADQLPHVEELAGGEPALWVRRDGKEWLVRDARFVARARALAAPVDALGKQEEAWGDEMQKLARDPEANSRRMSELGRKMGALGKKIEAAAREMERRLYALVDEARAAGVAQPLP